MFDKKRKASQYKGVYKCGRKWKSQIQLDGVQHYLGVFDTEERAAEVYSQMSNQLTQGRGGQNDTFGSHMQKSSVAHLRLIHSFAASHNIALVSEPNSPSASVKHENALILLKIQLGSVIRKLTELNQELMNHTTAATTSSSVSSNEVDHSSMDIENQMIDLLRKQKELTAQIVNYPKESSTMPSLTTSV